MPLERGTRGWSRIVRFRVAPGRGVRPWAKLSRSTVLETSPFWEGCPVEALRLPMRSKFFRYSDRASYKTSEVVGLFIISLFLGMITFGICMAIDYAVRQLYRMSGF